jgi:hypothetical protein
MSEQKTKFSSSDQEILISKEQARPPLWNDGHPDYKKTIITSELYLEGCVANTTWHLVLT